MKRVSTLVSSMRRHQVFTLSSGILVANVISLVAMPLLTRVYPASSFGYMALYLAIVNIVGLFSNFRLEMSIPLPKDAVQAGMLSWLCLGLALGVALIALVVLLLFPFGRYMQSMPSGSLFPFLVFAGITALGVIQTLAQVKVRLHQLKIMALRHIAERVAVIAVAFALPTLDTEYGLIWAQAAGYAASILVLSAGGDGSFALAWRQPWANFKAIFKMYSDFPLKNSASMALQALTTQTPAIVYSVFFSAAQIGQLSVVQRIIDAPNTIVGSSLAVSYYRRMLDSTPAERWRIFSRVTLLSVPLIAIPALIAFIFAEPIMHLLVNRNMTEAPTYLRLLLPAAVFRLIYLLQATLFMVGRRLDLDLTVAALTLVFTGLALGVGVTIGEDLHTPVALNSLAQAVTFGCGFVMLGWLARSYKRS